MYKYTVYIEAKDFVLPLVIYAENRKKAGKKGIDQFNRIFKNKERIVTSKGICIILAGMNARRWNLGKKD